MKPLQPDENLVCDECGRHGAVDFGERRLCPDCVETSGSCCPEFGRSKETSPEEMDP